MEPSLYKSVSEEESLQFTRKKTETKKLSKTTQPTDPAYSEYPAYSEHTVCVLRLHITFLRAYQPKNPV